MSFITTAEQIGIEKGVRQGLLRAVEFGLELKFGVDGLRLYPEIRKIEDLDVLEAITEGLKIASRLEEIESIYKPRPIQPDAPDETL
jgi:hypothetical protein